MSDVLHAVFFVAIFGAIFVAVMLAEAYYWKLKGRLDIYNLKETVASVATGFSYKMVDGVAVALFIQFYYEDVYQWGLQYTPEHGLWSVLLLFVIVDFAFYWMHRTTHKVRWFWASHVTHHSGEHMNYSTALRQNFWGVLNMSWVIWWTPIALIGFDKNWAMLAIEANLVYQFFLHTHAFDNYGPLGKIFNTPSHHRVHHGSNPLQIDTNFGGVLIIWDKLFGTFVPEEKAGEIIYGVTRKPSRPYNPIYLQLHEVVAMMQDVWKYKDLRILIKHPGWVAEKYGDTAPTPTHHTLNITR